MTLLGVYPTFIVFVEANIFIEENRLNSKVLAHWHCWEDCSFFFHSPRTRNYATFSTKETGSWSRYYFPLSRRFTVKTEKPPMLALFKCSASMVRCTTDGLTTDSPFAARSLIKSRPLDNDMAECLRQRDMIYHPMFHLTFLMRKSFGYGTLATKLYSYLLMLMQGCLPCRRGVETIQNIKPHLRLHQEGLWHGMYLSSFDGRI